MYLMPLLMPDGAAASAESTFCFKVPRRLGSRNGMVPRICHVYWKNTIYIHFIYICDYLYVCMNIYIYLYIYVHIPGVSEHFDFHCLFCSARLKNVLSFWLVVLIQKGWVRLRAANKNIKTQPVYEHMHIPIV